MQKQHASYEEETNVDSMLLNKIAYMEVLIKQKRRKWKSFTEWRLELGIRRN
jgi:hypothetical protein